jgi:hypothetical protein
VDLRSEQSSESQETEEKPRARERKSHINADIFGERLSMKKRLNWKSAHQYWQFLIKGAFLAERTK